MSMMGIIEVATAAAEKFGPLSSRLALAGDEGPKDVLVPENIPLLPIPVPPLGGPVCSIPEKDTFSNPFDRLLVPPLPLPLPPGLIFMELIRTVLRAELFGSPIVAYGPSKPGNSSLEGTCFGKFVVAKPLEIEGIVAVPGRRGLEGVIARG